MTRFTWQAEVALSIFPPAETNYCDKWSRTMIRTISTFPEHAASTVTLP